MNFGYQKIITSNYVLKFNNNELYFFPSQTNGIVFLRIKFDLSGLPAECQQFLPLFAKTITKIGPKTLDQEKSFALSELYTSNFECNYETFINKDGQIKEILVMSIASLDKNIENIFNMLNEILTIPNFSDHSTLSKLMNFYGAEEFSNMIENSLDFAISLSVIFKYLSIISLFLNIGNIIKRCIYDLQINNKASGIRQNVRLNDSLNNSRFICKFGEDLMKNMDIIPILKYIEEHFIKIQNYIFNQNKMKFSLNSGEDNLRPIQRRIEILLNALKISYPNFTKNTQQETIYPQFKQKIYKHYFVLPMDQNYVAESFYAPQLSHQDSPTLFVLSKMLKNCVLQQEINYLGGAYDCGALYSSNGYFTMYSYRDPHSLQTFEAFEKAVQFLAESEFNDDEIYQAIIESFSHLENLNEPQNKGKNLFLYDIQDQERVQFRSRLINVNRDDIVKCANEYLLNKMKNSESSQIIFGSQDNNLDGLISRGWKIERPVDGFSVNSNTYFQNQKNQYKFQRDKFI